MQHSPPGSRIVEAVPNFSVGRDHGLIAAIAEALDSVPGARVLHVDIGAGANRTVYTLAGWPRAVVQACLEGTRIASKRIDMRQHTGVHPRIGALDVLPLVPIQGLCLDETANIAHLLGHRIGDAFGIPVFFYGEAAFHEHRRNLAAVRKGEYEGLAENFAAGLRPDAGPKHFNPFSGASAVGARKFLGAYNVNLASNDLSAAKRIAAAVRSSGGPGRLPHLKAIGWQIPEYGIAQVSMNLTDLDVTGLHDAFDAVRAAAALIGQTVTGSELIGLIPAAYLAASGRAALSNPSAPETEAFHAAINYLGLDDLAPFVCEERVLEARLKTLLL